MLNLQSIYFGQRHKDFDFKDYEVIRKVKRLYHKQHRQCENACNGYGYVKGQVYYLGTIDDYAHKTYGYNVKSGYISDDVNVFDEESQRLEEKINKIVYQFNHDKYALWRVKPFRVEFQGDPRGYTVKLYYNDELIEW